MTIQDVAVIGVGAMGAPMAMNIHKAGFNLTVCDRSPDARKPFSEIGARCTESAADCADCDAVIILVATPDQAQSVIFGDGGVVSGISEKRPVLIVMGTILPETIKSFERNLEPYGIQVVDAPISGGVVKARDGTLAIIMGGKPEDCESVKPLMQAMGEKIFYCGPLGAGQTTKIINNMVGISTLMIAAEAYRIALDNGLSLPYAMPVFEAGTGRNFMTGAPKDASNSYAAWASKRADFDSLQAILRKDIDLGLSIGAASGPLPMTRALRAMLADVGDETFENWSKIASTATTAP